jgi:hypothetical protein
VNFILIGGFGVATAFAVWHVATAPRPAYEIPIETAEARLSDMSFEEGMLTGQPFSLSAQPDGSARVLRWRFGKPGPDGRPSSCTLRIETTEPGRTAAKLDCAVHRRGLDAGTAARSGELLELIMSEHVDSTLKGREFDHESMGKKLIAFSLLHQAAFAQMARQDNAKPGQAN